jgi:lambda repressor-like predicted transcriptional regulator
VNPHHLFLGTQADNVADMNSKGRGVIPRGERNGNAKLTLEQVLAIEADTRLQRVIAKEYGVVQQTVSNIKRGTHWSQRNAA